jgi:phosphate transport system permease protein
VRVVVPAALPGIVNGVLLAIPRIIGETAPVLVLVRYARSINYDVFDGNMASLPLLIYTQLITRSPPANACLGCRFERLCIAAPSPFDPTCY